MAKRSPSATSTGRKSALKVMDADGTNVKTVVEMPKTVNEGGRMAWKP